ncbi:MAG: isoleucine--tRNA ligase [Desulfobulbus propionicus]|nr:MAG: isoleucine--tRNA ligase [Desulfobulbus propionicus]
MDYRETLNLPKTSFKMKANLPQKEPVVLKRWEKEGLYARLQQHTRGRPDFILHDGPPYANGNIHLGTAFNKVLKDIILRSKRMAGFNAPYIPGWDCHGLPIEHNVDKELGEKKKDIPILAKRAACRKYAEKWIKTQKSQFKRLGVLGDWASPYLTMNFAYEAAIAAEFNKFLLSGAVVRSKKPVYWCSTCTTALAEAEVEYNDHVSSSVYVKFPVTEDLSAVSGALSGKKISILIWTTTPWTLPANLAVAFHPDVRYAAVEVDDEVWIMAEDLVESCFTLFDRSGYTLLTTFSATRLEGKKCRHPFLERDSLIVLADYVTTDTGTGCVHTAPGHGADDYLTGLRYDLEILSPVDDEGRYTAAAGKYAGQQVPEVNEQIIEDLDADGMLVKQTLLNHSYPHCWRCKKPVMYRATAQWFLSMEAHDLRRKALHEIEQVKWTPAWGEQRIFGMIEARPDWCLSRQRSWGVPITVLTCGECGEMLKDERMSQLVDAFFSKEGADAWFKHDAEDFVPEGVRCSCGSTRFNKETDILDVWFDSGTSHAAVLEQRDELHAPADLYLEGSDQHRGWFHSSLLTSVGTREHAPYKGVLTHGYVVDGKGKKMSKSIGNVVAPQEVIDKFGAEILRLWVSSENYQDDVKVSDEILRQVSDAYRKIRNTIRFLLGNLSDFDPNNDRVAFASLEEIDRWALAKFAEVTEKVVRAYERYEFHSIYHTLFIFCGTVISSIYMDVLKDRLYCSAPDAPGRRAAQTAIYQILDGLLRLMAPILCFTADEAWAHFRGHSQDKAVEHSIAFAEFPRVDNIVLDQDFLAHWEQLLSIRGAITKVLERARREKVIGLSLDAEVILSVEGKLMQFVQDNRQQLQELCIVSSLKINAQDDEGVVYVEDDLVTGLKTAVRAAPGKKCERCWMFSSSAGEDKEHPALCARCASVVKELS